MANTSFLTVQLTRGRSGPPPVADYVMADKSRRRDCIILLFAREIKKVLALQAYPSKLG